MNTFFNELFQQSVAAQNEGGEQSTQQQTMNRASPTTAENSHNSKQPSGGGNAGGNPVMDQNVFEFLSKIEKQNRVAKSIHFSDTHSDIVASIVNERMSTAAATAYTTNSDDPNKTGSEEDLESLNYNYIAPVATTRRNSFLLKQRKSIAPALPVSLNKSNIKTTRITIKNSATGQNENSFERNLMAVAQPVLFMDEFLPLNSEKGGGKTPLKSTTMTGRLSTAKSTTYNRVASSASSSFKSMTISTSTSNKSSAGTPLSMATTNTSSNSRMSPISRGSTRLSDLVFTGCKRVTMATDGKTPDNSYESFNSDSMMSRFVVDDENTLLTPSFRVKRYNLRDERQLELAKRDVYKRYAVISIPLLRNMAAQTVNGSRQRSTKLAALVK